MLIFGGNKKILDNIDISIYIHSLLKTRQPNEKKSNENCEFCPRNIRMCSVSYQQNYERCSQNYYAYYIHCISEST